MKTRVVVTGMGAITPIGNDVESFWNGLKEKKVGIGHNGRSRAGTAAVPVCHDDPDDSDGTDE